MDEFNKRYLEFCKPFIQAIKEIYSTMMSTELEAGSPEIKKGSISHGEFSSIMGINGVYETSKEKKGFRGTLALSWPHDVYLKSAGAMLMEEFAEYNDEIADVGMEICNITMGNAKKNLCQEGYLIEMSIPTSVRGKDHEIKAQEGVVTIATPLKSDLGTFWIELCYEDYEL